MGFSRQEYWSGLPFPSPGDLPNPGIELRSPTLGADALTSEPPEKPQEEPKAPSKVTPAPHPCSELPPSPALGQGDPAERAVGRHPPAGF